MKSAIYYLTEPAVWGGVLLYGIPLVIIFLLIMKVFKNPASIGDKIGFALQGVGAFTVSYFLIIQLCGLISTRSNDPHFVLAGLAAMFGMIPAFFIGVFTTWYQLKKHTNLPIDLLNTGKKKRILSVSAKGSNLK